MDDFPIAFQIIKKLGDSVHLDSLLNSKNIVELRLAKGELIRANIISMDDSLLKNESYKFIDNISKVIGERVNKENHNQIKLKKTKDFIRESNPKKLEKLTSKKNSLIYNEENELKNIKISGLQKYEQKSYKNALQIFEKGKLIFKKDDELFFWIGRCNYQLKKHYEAKLAFSSAIKIYQKDQYFYWRHKCNKSIGNIVLAKKDLIQAIEMNPKNENIYKEDLEELKKENYSYRKNMEYKKNLKQRKVIQSLKTKSKTLIEEDFYESTQDNYSENVKDASNEKISFAKWLVDESRAEEYDSFGEGLFKVYVIPGLIGLICSLIFAPFGFIVFIVGYGLYLYFEYVKETE